MEVTSCPGCDGKESKVIGRPGDSFDSIVGKKTFHHPKYFVRRCQECGLCYKTHVLSASELDAYYQETDFRKWEIPELFPTEKAIIRALSHLPLGGSILDYGCSSGRLLAQLKDKYRCFGVERDSQAAEMAKGKGISIVEEQEVLGSSGNGFDAIVLSDVFEHLPQPTKVLEQLSRQLKPRGVLLLSTGNADSAACGKDIANFWYLRTPEHLCMITKEYARFLSARMGLKLVLWGEMTHYDFDRFEKLRQSVKNFAYWQFQSEGPSIRKSFLGLTPFINRAKYWIQPPAFTCSKDHVLVGYARTGR